jgi:hypothetical protein
MVKHITINHQILEQNNNYQDIEILYQESWTLMRIIIIDEKVLPSFIQWEATLC